MRVLHVDQQRAAASARGTVEAHLSPRQAECLFWVQEGKSSRDIGVILGLSHRSVERHVFKACAALGVKTRLQAVIRARALGLIGDGPQAAALYEGSSGLPPSASSAIHCSR